MDDGKHDAWAFLAASPARRRVLELARHASRTDCAVLIVGPTGVGKDLLAEEIHRHSARNGRRFVALNCAALGSELFESEMFGHARGAFTSAHAAKQGLVEVADGGTLFLDEVGELCLDAQAKLLRVLSTGRFWSLGETRERTSDVRLISATNRDLRLMLGKAFREDLFYRLNVITLMVPSLETSDVRVLSERFVEELEARRGQALSPSERALLSARVAERRFSGGARQIRNLLERFFLVHRPNRSIDASLAEAGELGPLDEEEPSSERAAPRSEGGALALQRLDDLLFLDAARSARTVRELASRLGKSPQAVYQRMRRLQVTPRDLGDGEKISKITMEARRHASSCLPWLQAMLTTGVDS